MRQKVGEMRNFDAVKEKFDFVLDQVESGRYIREVYRIVDEKLREFSTAGEQSRKVALKVDISRIRVDIIRDVDGAIQDALVNVGNGRAAQVSLESLVESGFDVVIREIVSEWDAESIVERSAELQRIGLAKGELAEMLYDKMDSFDGDLMNDEYVELVSTSEYLYEFIDKEFEDDFGYEIPFDVIDNLVRHDADKETIAQWIADRHVSNVFSEDARVKMKECDVMPSEGQIIESLRKMPWLVDELVFSHNEEFLRFLDEAEDAYWLICELDNMTYSFDRSPIFEEYISYCDKIEEAEVRKYPKLWRALATRFFTVYDEGVYDELRATIKILVWLEISQSDWVQMLYGHRKWLNDCLEDMAEKRSLDFSREEWKIVELLKFAS